MEKCFGFYLDGAHSCREGGSCKVRLRCKSVLVSDGLALVAGAIEEMVRDLPEGEYSDTDRLSGMVEHLMNGPGQPVPPSGLSVVETEELTANLL